MKPYKEEIISENRVIRTFKSNTEEGELTWHRDREDRIIFPINENNWLFQEDDCTPIPMNVNEPIFIESGKYHRIIKGSEDLQLEIYKTNLDEEEGLKDTISEIFNLILEKKKRKKKRRKKKKKKKSKGDRCTRIAKSKYDVWPSAYASGAVVRCRKGDIWKDLKEEDFLEVEIEDDIDYLNEEDVLEIDFNDLEEAVEEAKKTNFSKEKKYGLHGWFKRRGGKGSKGWVDCNTCRKDSKTGRKKCKSCGREEGEKRKKYPSCRPTPSDCKSKGKGKTWGKKK